MRESRFSDVAPFTTYRIGGKVKHIVESQSSQELAEQVSSSSRYIILGGGSNVLFSSKGFDGDVIVNRSSCITIQKDCVCVDSGVSMARLSNFYLDNSLGTLAWACSVPGTVGGAVQGNSGAFGGCIADAVIAVEVMGSGGKAHIITREQCGFHYRSSSLSGFIILRVWLKMKKCDKNEILAARQDFIARRKKSQPTGASAGSVFKMAAKPAGWYIENAGLKGARVNDAVVSCRHANFIINEGNATSDDVLSLILLIKQSVYEKYKVKLEEEIKILGDF